MAWVNFPREFRYKQSPFYLFSRFKTLKMMDDKHLNILKEGVRFWNAWRKENEITEPDFRGVDLKGIDLGKFTDAGTETGQATSLRGGDPEVTIITAELYNANLEKADLSSANLRGTNLSGAKLRGANLNEADLRDVNLSGADLTRADL